MSAKRKIVFVTGTRADYGKMKPLMQILEESDQFDIYVFVCGMHLAKQFGSTYKEVLKDGYSNTHIAFGLLQSSDMSTNLGNTVSYLSGYIGNIEPDMIIVHGDRVDALAGAIVGALRNVRVGHIEGGELSGTVDESIRHAISKFAHAHFVCNSEARDRLIQLGEEEERIYIIGSPDIDIMMSDALPPLQEAKDRYGIGFEGYGILMYHPVTTEYHQMAAKAREVVDAVKESGRSYVVIYPNNDLGSDFILREYDRLKGDPRFRLFPSIRFEYFLTLLKHADFLIGNSSAGVRESGIYGIPAIDIGTRQQRRYDLLKAQNIMHVDEDKEQILDAVRNADSHRLETRFFGDGNSAVQFYDILKQDGFWRVSIQKRFADYVV